MKRSKSNRCGQWIHAARAGDVAHVRVGGKFFASAEDLAGPLLLVAGGIGISPLYAVLRTLLDRSDTHTPAHATTPSSNGGGGAGGHETARRPLQATPYTLDLELSIPSPVPLGPGI